MQSTDYHLQKRTVGEAAIRLGKFVFASGKKGFMWNRGRRAMKSVLKGAEPSCSDCGFPEYTKYGGIRQAMRDFNAARLHGVGNKLDTDGVEWYYGFAGEVGFWLEVTDDSARLWVNKAANEVRKGKGFVIHYI